MIRVLARGHPLQIGLTLSLERAALSIGSCLVGEESINRSRQSPTNLVINKKMMVINIALIIK